MRVRSIVNAQVSTEHYFVPNSFHVVNILSFVSLLSV